MHKRHVDLIVAEALEKVAKEIQHLSSDNTELALRRVVRELRKNAQH